MKEIRVSSYLANGIKARSSWTLRRLLSRGLLLLVLVPLGWYLYENIGIFYYLKKIRWHQILWITALDTTSYVAMSLQNYLILKHFDSSICFIDCLLLQYVNSSLNRIFPTLGAGAAFRAFYLKKKYKLAYPAFISTVGGLYVISFLGTSLIGMFCLIIMYCHQGVFSWVIFMCFALLFIICLSVILFSPQIPKSDYRVMKALKNAVNGWKIIRRNHNLILLTSFLTAILLLISTLSNTITYQALGFSPGFVPMLYLSALGVFITLLNITPDGIGIREGIYAFSFRVVHLPKAILVLGSLLLRGITLVMTLAISFLGYYFLARDLGLGKKTSNGR